MVCSSACARARVCVCVRCREGFISPSSDQPSVVSLGFHQQTFVSVRSSDEPLASVHVSLSLPVSQGLSPSQPQECMSRNAWRDQLDQTSSKRRWSLAVSRSLPACLSPPRLPLLLLLRRVFLLSPRPCSSPFFPPCCSCKPFCCSFSPLLPPLLLFSPLPPLFLWHERDTKRSFECLCV